MQSVRRSLLAIALASLIVPCNGVHAVTPTYSIGFYSINTGGKTLRGSCYVLAGSVGQVAPGYASSATYAEYAGFWTPALAPAPALPADEIFFNGFEEC